MMDESSHDDRRPRRGVLERRGASLPSGRRLLPGLRAALGTPTGRALATVAAATAAEAVLRWGGRLPAVRRSSRVEPETVLLWAFREEVRSPDGTRSTLEFLLTRSRPR